MTKTSKTVVFFGNERLATAVSTSAPTLRALIANGYKVAAVVSSFEPGRSRNARSLEVEVVAKKHDIPLLLPKKPADIIDQLKSFDAATGVLVAYGQIVPQSVIDVFPRGIVNIHPSMLPKHRGPTPLESVILDGSQSTGVSIMALEQKMDAGPVYAQSEVELSGKETKQELADHLLDVGQAMLIEVLPGILDGSVIGRPQDDSGASYDKLIQKADGQLDWQKAAKLLERQIRAYAGWPGSHAVMAGKDVTILAATVVNKTLGVGEVGVEDKQLIIGTGQGSLQIERLKPAGKSEMTAQAFLAGYGSRL